MNVIAFEDIEDYCSSHPCTKDEFLNMMKRCVFRNRSYSRQGSYAIYMRSADGPIPKKQTLSQLTGLLSRITLGLLVSTNAASLVCWRNVEFEPYDQ
jgi:hypothetical protein